MRYSMLIHGEKDISPEEIVFNSKAPAWNPLVVILSGADPLLRRSNVLSFDFLLSGQDGAGSIRQLIADIQGAIVREKYNAVVFLNLSGFSMDLLAFYRASEGNYAGKMVFSNIVSLVAHALNLPCPVYFHTYTRRGKEDSFFRPALGEKTLSTILPKMNFVGFLMRVKAEPHILFKTKTGAALVKDPLGVLSMERADLGLIQEKIFTALKEKERTNV